MSATHTPGEFTPQPESGRGEKVLSDARRSPLSFLGSEELLYQLCLETASGEEADSEEIREPVLPVKPTPELQALIRGLADPHPDKADAATTDLLRLVRAQKTAIARASLLQYITREAVRSLRQTLLANESAPDASDTPWHIRMLTLLRQRVTTSGDRLEGRITRVPPAFYLVLERLRMEQDHQNTGATVEYLISCRTLDEFALKYSILVYADCNAEFVYDELLKRSVAGVLQTQPNMEKAQQDLAHCAPEQLHVFIRNLAKEKYAGLEEGVKQRILEAAKTALVPLSHTTPA